MSLLDTGLVWCETSVESATVWIHDDDVSPVELSGRLLEHSPLFARNAQEEALNLLLMLVTRGILLLRSGEVGVYSLSPVRAEGFTWDPEGNRLTLHAVSALWTLASPQLRGEVAPTLYAAVCRRYYHSVLGRIVEADLQSRMRPWRNLTGEEAERRISEDVLESFRTLADQFPAERYQTLIRDRSLAGVEPGEIYEEICRDMLHHSARRLRSLRAEHGLRV